MKLERQREEVAFTVSRHLGDVALLRRRAADDDVGGAVVVEVGARDAHGHLGAVGRGGEDLRIEVELLAIDPQHVERDAVAVLLRHDGDRPVRLRVDVGVVTHVEGDAPEPTKGRAGLDAKAGGIDAGVVLDVHVEDAVAEVAQEVGAADRGGHRGAQVEVEVGEGVAAREPRRREGVDVEAAGEGLGSAEVEQVEREPVVAGPEARGLHANGEVGRDDAARQAAEGVAPAPVVGLVVVVLPEEGGGGAQGRQSRTAAGGLGGQGEVVDRADGVDAGRSVARTHAERQAGVVDGGVVGDEDVERPTGVHLAEQAAGQGAQVEREGLILAGVPGAARTGQGVDRRGPREGAAQPLQVDGVVLRDVVLGTELDLEDRAHDAAGQVLERRAADRVDASVIEGLGDRVGGEERGKERARRERVDRGGVVVDAALLVADRLDDLRRALLRAGNALPGGDRAEHAGGGDEGEGGHGTDDGEREGHGISPARCGGPLFATLQLRDVPGGLAHRRGSRRAARPVMPTLRLTHRDLAPR